MDWLPIEYLVTCRMLLDEHRERISRVNVWTQSPFHAVAKAAEQLGYPDDAAYSVGMKIGAAYVSMRESFMCSKRDV